MGKVQKRIKVEDQKGDQEFSREVPERPEGRPEGPRGLGRGPRGRTGGDQERDQEEVRWGEQVGGHGKTKMTIKRRYRWRT